MKRPPAPPDSPHEAEFRAFAEDWARSLRLRSPVLTNDKELLKALGPGVDVAPLRSAMALASLRARGIIRGSHAHYRDRYIIALCAVGEDSGLSRDKARWILADVSDLHIQHLRKIDRAKVGFVPGGAHPGGVDCAP